MSRILLLNWLFFLNYENRFFLKRWTSHCCWLFIHGWSLVLWINVSVGQLFKKMQCNADLLIKAWSDDSIFPLIFHYTRSEVTQSLMTEMTRAAAQLNVNIWNVFDCKFNQQVFVIRFCVFAGKENEKASFFPCEKKSSSSLHFLHLQISAKEQNVVFLPRGSTWARESVTRRWSKANSQVKK